MIVLVCPNCTSDNLEDVKEATFDDYFTCKNCDEVFTFQDALWKNE